VDKLTTEQDAYDYFNDGEFERIFGRPELCDKWSDVFEFGSLIKAAVKLIRQKERKER